MDNGIRVGHYKQDDGEVFLPIGYIPDYIRLANRDGTNTNFYEWWRRMESDDASGSQEGIQTANGGTTTDLGDGAGITAFDTGSQQPASGFDAGELSEWNATTAVDVRTATAPGSYAKPTVGALDDTGGVTDRDAIFENVGSADGNTGAAEPVWPSAIGGQVVDSNAIWEKVNTPTFRGGYQGISVASALNTDGQEMYYLAIRAHDSINHGDVDGWAGGVDPDWS